MSLELGVESQNWPRSRFRVTTGLGLLRFTRVRFFSVNFDFHLLVTAAYSKGISFLNSRSKKNYEKQKFFFFFFLTHPGRSTLGQNWVQVGQTWVKFRSSFPTWPHRPKVWISVNFDFRGLILEENLKGIA